MTMVPVQVLRMGVRAQAEAQLGDLAAASDDLNKAEDFERRAIAEMGP